MPPRLPGSTSANALSSALRNLQLDVSKSNSEIASTCMKCLYERSALSKSSSNRFFHSGTILNGKPRAKPTVYRKDMSPWAVAKREAIRKGNIEKQKKLNTRRIETAADPIVGNPTDFNQSILVHPEAPLPIDEMIKNASPKYQKRSEGELIKIVSEKEEFGPMVYNLEPNLLKFALHNSEDVTRPLIRKDEQDPNILQRHIQRHGIATAAMHRILSLGNSGTRDVKHAHNKRCIDLFGRHNTDNTLPARMKRLPDGTLVPRVAEPRAGLDTGSSEVQIAIFTGKIQALAQHVKINPKDKHNARNLRLLVHRRQGLLKYLKRKERGGPRYQNILDQIGLDDRAVTEELFTEKTKIAA